MTWVEFLKSWAEKKKMKYPDAMKDPKAKIAWEKEKLKMAKDKRRMEREQRKMEKMMKK